MAVVFPAPAGAIAAAAGHPSAHLPDQRSLPDIQGGLVRRHLQQSQIHRRLVDDRAAEAAGGGNEPLLGVEDPLRCIPVGPGHGIDRGSVRAPQRLRFLDVVRRWARATDR
jgi:hypothetical protein